jgi:pSer/pThr/pTyr-binding forkhead associated (FHA) protein
MARLVIFDDCVRGVDLPGHAVIIGRSRRVDVPIRDGLLSRKHCSIVPVDSGFRLIDLKSANGTFVNGIRVEKEDLHYDDIIELGNTVVVLLDTETWSRGEGLTRLRNPLKAQELIQRLNRKAPRSGASPSLQPAAGAAHPSFPELGVGGEEFLVSHIVARHTAMLVSRSPEIEALAGRVLERLLESTSVPDERELRRRVRELIEEVRESHDPPAAAVVPAPELGTASRGLPLEETGPRAGAGA